MKISRATTATTPLPRRTLVSPQEAADRLGVSTRTVRRRIADGSIIGYRVGPRLIRVDVAQVFDALHRIPTGGEPHGDTAA